VEPEIILSTRLYKCNCTIGPTNCPHVQNTNKTIRFWLTKNAL